MKRFCLVTLALLLLLTACSGVSPSPSAEVEDPTPSVAVSPEVSPSPEPSPDPEVLIREQFELEAEGKMLLTEEELLWFETEFFNMDEFRIRNMFLNRSYDTPQEINMKFLFYHGAYSDVSYTVSDDERAMLNDIYTKAGFANYVDNLDVSEVTADEMDAVLLQYTGLSLEETDKNGLDNGLDGLVYLEPFNAYYNIHSDSEYSSYKFSYGYWNDNGSVCMLYDSSSILSTSIVTLVPSMDGFWFVSNRKILL